jgi:aconitate hydratase
MSHFSSASNLTVGTKTYKYFSMAGLDVQKLPYSLKILLENMLRTKDGANVTQAHVDALVAWDPNKEPDTEIQFSPARVIMQDFTGVPCIVDLATMREAVQELGGDPQSINPLTPAEMVIDHSVVADVSGAKQ